MEKYIQQITEDYVENHDEYSQFFKDWIAAIQTAPIEFRYRDGNLSRFLFYLLRKVDELEKNYETILKQKDTNKKLKSIDINIYKKKWTRLNINQKLNRINNYLDNLLNEKKILEENCIELKIKFSKILNLLSKKNYIDYNEDNGIINDIIILNYNKNKNKYIIEL